MNIKNSRAIICMIHHLKQHGEFFSDSLWPGEKPSFSFAQVLKQLLGLKFITDNSGRLFE